MHKISELSEFELLEFELLEFELSCTLIKCLYRQQNNYVFVENFL